MDRKYPDVVFQDQECFQFRQTGIGNPEEIPMATRFLLNQETEPKVTPE